MTEFGDATHPDKAQLKVERKDSGVEFILHNERFGNFGMAVNLTVEDAHRLAELIG